MLLTIQLVMGPFVQAATSAQALPNAPQIDCPMHSAQPGSAGSRTAQSPALIDAQALTQSHRRTGALAQARLLAHAGSLTHAGSLAHTGPDAHTASRSHALTASHGSDGSHGPQGSHECCQATACQCHCVQTPALLDLLALIQPSTSLIFPLFSSAPLAAPRIHEFLRPPIA